MMAAHISLKNSLLMLLGGLVCAVGTAFLLNFLLSGPALGPHYDFLQKYKPSNVSREILVINTEDIIESSDIFSVLLTLTEMEASNLILTGRVSSISSPIMLTETEVRRRFYDEYILLGSNIRKLFEGIRAGTVHPAQAPVFVEQVVELAEQGRDRLVSALIDRDEDLIRSAAVFGNYLQFDLRPSLDRDGKLRRVNITEPDGLEHPVYSSLKNRYAISQIEPSGKGQVLWLRSHNATDFDILLDKGGNIITAGNENLRRIDIDVFRRYKNAENAMYEALASANMLRAFSQTPPDRIPLILYEYSQMFLDELLISPNIENRYAWIDSRTNYFGSLEEFLESSAQEAVLDMYLQRGLQYADADSSYEETPDNLIPAKDELAEIFLRMREIYDELSSLHSQLLNDLELSFCIMGQRPNAEYSALLANALITGSHVTPADEVSILIWSITAVFIVLLTVFLFRPILLLPSSVFLSFLSAAVFTFIFVHFSYWIDPLIPLLSSLTGTFVIFVIKCAYLNFRARSFRYAYKTSISREALRGVIKSGSPRLSQVSSSFAAVIAVKDVNLHVKEGREEPQDAVKLKRIYYATAKKLVYGCGAVIAGFEGDTILVCFGSPIDKSYYPVTKACNLVRSLMKNEKILWHFGVDAGECSFSWSPETGFSVSGRPAVRARILAAKAARFKTKALVTNSVLEKIHQDGKKIGTFNDESGAVYEMPEGNLPGA